MTPRDLADELSAHLHGYGDRPFIEYERRWYPGDVVTRYIGTVLGLLESMGACGDTLLGLVSRNRLPHAAVALGLIADRRPVAMIHSYQSHESIARDIAALAPGVVIADRQDWTDATVDAARQIGCGAVALSLDPGSPDPLGVEMLVAPDPARLRSARTEPGAAGLHVLSSGTTGPPKRVPLRTEVLGHTVTTMTMGGAGRHEDPPELVYWPFGSVGICQLLAAPFLDKRMVLLEKFTVDEWVRAVRTYRIARTGVQPALLRMLLDADVPREDLASLEYLPGGSGPLEPELRAEFEDRYGIPLLWAYGATEFAGSVCAWTPDDHRRYGADKSRSVGRPMPGVAVRVVDPDSGAEVGVGEHGHLEGRVDVIGPDWIRTTDIASVDADGFVYLHGRGDGAIIRGGFKILPETVRAVLIRHPAVLDAAVVGVDDRRLGQVPFAAVELRSGSPAPTETQLCDLVRGELPRHHVPVAVAIVPSLPRNAAWKVTVREVAALYRPRD